MTDLDIEWGKLPFGYFKRYTCVAISVIEMGKLEISYSEISIFTCAGDYTTVRSL